MSPEKDKEELKEKMTKTTNESESRKDSEEQTYHSEDSGLPIDRGWAWMILLGSMIQMTLIVGLQKSSGIIFVAFQQRFNSTSSMTSLLSTVQNAAYSLSAPVVMTVGLKMASIRTMLFIGSIVTTLSYVISAYAIRIQILLFSYGVLQGIGMAFMVPPSVSVLGIYFLKRRGFANSVAVSGASVGGFILAPLITYMFKTYGYNGCLLLIGAILSNGCVSGALFRPRSFYTRHFVSRRDFQKLIPATLNKHTPTPNTKGNPSSVTPHAKTRKGPKLNVFEEELLFRSLPDISYQETQMRSRTYTNISQMSNWIKMQKLNSDSKGNVYNSRDYIRCSALDMNMESSNELKENRSQKTDKFEELLKGLIASFDFKLFRNPLFVMLLVIAFLICSSNLLAAIFLAPHANDLKISSDGIATIVTIFSGTDFISRVVVGVISDKGWLRRSTLVGIASLMVGLSSQFLVFCHTFKLLLIYTVILGVFSGAYFGLFPVVIVDYLTLEKLNSALGFVALCNGAGISLTFYLMGYIRDVTGSYIASYHVIGTMSLIGGVLINLLPFFQRYYEGKQQNKETVQRT